MSPFLTCFVFILFRYKQWRTICGANFVPHLDHLNIVPCLPSSLDLALGRWPLPLAYVCSLLKASNMDPSFFNDNGEEYFATTAECHHNNFFDIGFNYHPEAYEFSDTSNSNESNFFDDLSVGSANRDLFANDPLRASNMSFQRSVGNDPAPVPQSQKLVHRLRPEGAAISSAQLLALENNGPKPRSLRALARTRSPPASPPSTPLNRRSQGATPASTSCRPLRANKSRFGAGVNGSSKMMSSSACYSPNQDISDWTERFKNVSINNTDQNFPLSPPPSATISQEDHQHMQPTQGLDFIDGIFGPTSQPATHSTHSTLTPATSLYQSVLPSQSSWNPPSGTQDFFNSNASWDFSNSAFDIGTTRSVAAEQSLASAHHHFGMVDPGFGGGGLMISFEDLAGPSNTSNTVVSSASLEDTEALSTEIKQERPPDNRDQRIVHDDNSHCLPRLSRAKSIPDKLVRHRTFPSPSHSPVRGGAAHKLQHRRAKSHNSLRTPRTPKAPRTPRLPSAATALAATSAALSSGPSGNPHTLSQGRGPTSHCHQAQSQPGLGFVNFTPDDSMKILTGVAPSGSSKTKARREKEASERRRKLSEAAERAVRVAGGDIEAMRRELSV